MTKNYKLFFTLLTFVALCSSLNAVSFVPASDTFNIPKEPPDIKITANTMLVENSIATLQGNVKATKENDTLTCQKALVSNSPQWLLASITPCLRRIEPLKEPMISRKITLKADSIYVNADENTINASSSVELHIEEKAQNPASSTWVTVLSTEMTGYKNSNYIIFKGSVRVTDNENRFGKGDCLEYKKDESLAILSGSALLEVWEANKQGKREKRTLTGQTITYDTDTKEAISE